MGSSYRLVVALCCLRMWQCVMTMKDCYLLKHVICHVINCFIVTIDSKSIFSHIIFFKWWMKFGLSWLLLYRTWAPKTRWSKRCYASFPVEAYQKLGGFKDLGIVYLYLGKKIQYDKHTFQSGWNHKPEKAATWNVHMICSRNNCHLF